MKNMKNASSKCQPVHHFTNINKHQQTSTNINKHQQETGSIHHRHHHPKLHPDELPRIGVLVHLVSNHIAGHLADSGPGHLIPVASPKIPSHSMDQPGATWTCWVKVAREEHVPAPLSALKSSSCFRRTS